MANAITVDTWKGTSRHDDLTTQVKVLFVHDTGDVIVTNEIMEAEKMLHKLCVKLALPKLERNLSDLRFLWAWGLRPIWMATFHALLFVLGLVSLDPGIVLQLASMIVSLVARLLILGPLIRFVATPLAALSSKVTIFSSTALFTMHFKVHGVCGGTIEDRQWLLACRDIEIVGLSLAIATLETELGITDEDETTLLVVGCTISPQLSVCSRCSPCPCSSFFFSHPAVGWVWRFVRHSLPHSHAPRGYYSPRFRLLFLWRCLFG